LTQLEETLQQVRMVDTHEHQLSEQAWQTQTSILEALFQNYVLSDLMAAGASPAAIRRLVDWRDPDIAGRFAGVAPFWELVRHTGYGEAVALTAKLIYGIEEISAISLLQAANRHARLQQNGERLRLLRDEAGLDHVQIDDMRWGVTPDASAPEYFLMDMSWRDFSQGTFDLAALEQQTGVAVADLDDLRAAFAALFARHGPHAVAIKTQHAYGRTLKWEERSDAEVAPVFARYVKNPKSLLASERELLGDWCLARGVELATEYELPIKIHTGYYAGNNCMITTRIAPGQLAPLLARYPKARFVLMHASYPYGGELIALVKHFSNAWADLCWAWSIDPYSTCDFVRSFLHAAPLNKLLGFGGDNSWPTCTVGYAAQARLWLGRALQAEIDVGALTERQAIAVAERILRTNALDLFPVERAQQAMRSACNQGAAHDAT
jgi:predicted TIM-barrel fold metal-dependent hydrolase